MQCCRWEADVVGIVEQKHGKQKVSVSFECETLKAEDAAEEHIRKYMPNVTGLDAVGTFSFAYSYFLMPNSSFFVYLFLYIYFLNRALFLCGLQLMSVQ